MHTQPLSCLAQTHRHKEEHMYTQWTVDETQRLQHICNRTEAEKTHWSGVFGLVRSGHFVCNNTWHRLCVALLFFVFAPEFKRSHCHCNSSLLKVGIHRCHRTVKVQNYSQLLQYQPVKLWWMTGCNRHLYPSNHKSPDTKTLDWKKHLRADVYYIYVQFSFSKSRGFFSTRKMRSGSRVDCAAADCNRQHWAYHDCSFKRWPHSRINGWQHYMRNEGTSIVNSSDSAMGCLSHM